MNVRSLAILSLSLLALGGCGPGRNDPPTDAEITKIFSDICATSADQDTASFDFTGAKKAPSGVTQEYMGTKVHEVEVTMSYRAKTSGAIQCIGHGDKVNYEGKQRCLFFVVVRSGGTAVNQGDTFSCDVTLDFTKADEGWLPAGFSNKYLVKR